MAAYLRYWIDDWKGVYPKINKKPAILGTLYNLGDNAKAPNANPEANGFGKYVKKKYRYVRRNLNYKGEKK